MKFTADAAAELCGIAFRNEDAVRTFTGKAQNYVGVVKPILDTGEY